VNVPRLVACRIVCRSAFVVPPSGGANLCTTAPRYRLKAELRALRFKTFIQRTAALWPVIRRSHPRCGRLSALWPVSWPSRCGRSPDRATELDRRSPAGFGIGSKHRTSPLTCSLKRKMACRCSFSWRRSSCAASLESSAVWAPIGLAWPWDLWGLNGQVSEIILVSELA